MTNSWVEPPSRPALETALPALLKQLKLAQFRSQWQAAEEQAHYAGMSERALSAEIKRLEKQMNAEAKNLEFEKAAATRDRLSKVKEMAFGARSRDFLG